ncbi:hypothetical protein GCM10029964_092790 [Kibdelosporangium lantanae]
MKFVTPIAYAEVLLRHPARPDGLDAVPALSPSPAAGWVRFTCSDCRSVHLGTCRLLPLFGTDSQS